MKWLITGGCGFLGLNLVRFLYSSGDASIRILDNLSVGSEEDLRAVRSDYSRVDRIDAPPSSGEIELFVGDVRDGDTAIAAARDMDVIVHFAANTGVGPSVEDPRKDCLTNVVGTMNMLEGARLNGTKRFVFASSGAPLGEVEPPIHEELAPHPLSPYGASKLAGEGYCSAYAGTFGVGTVALRFGNVYGPGSKNKSSVVAAFIKRAMAGQPLEIYGDGSQTRDFIFVEDLIDAVNRAATFDGIGGEIFQIAANTETTVTDISKLVLDGLQRAGIPPVDIYHGEARIGDMKRNYSDISKAVRMLGWKPVHTLEQGVDRTIAYFVNQAAGDVG